MYLGCPDCSGFEADAVLDEIVYLYFFMDSNTSGSLINRLKHFISQFQFAETFTVRKLLVHDTAESDSAVRRTP